MDAFEGHEAIRDFVEDWLAAYEDLHQVIEQFRDLGGATLALLLQRARPRGSSGVVAIRYAIVGTWRDGLVERFSSTPTSTKPAQPPNGSPRNEGRRCPRRTWMRLGG
jgi:hypothetical protein